MAELSDEARARLDAILPANWSRANPVDILGDAPVSRYVATMQELLSRDESGSILFVHAPTAIVPSAEIAKALLPFAQRKEGQPARLLSCWLGDDAVRQARATFRAAGVADYDTPEEAVRAFSLLQQWRKLRDLLDTRVQLPTATPPLELCGVRAILDRALHDGREWLLEDEAKAVLAAAGIPTVATRHAEPNADAAIEAAREIGFPVVLKILSPDLLHKSDLGGVALDLGDEEELRIAANAMLLQLKKSRPDARLVGFSVQTMVRARGAVELILGASIDPTFGPVLLFGHGGTAVELLADRALALPPLDAAQADAFIARTRVQRLLHGYRNQSAADCASVRNALVALSRLVAAVPEIAQLDINPLLATPDGCIALDARIQVKRDAPGGAARFALRNLRIASVDQARAITPHLCTC
jgi:acetyltransferase